MFRPKQIECAFAEEKRNEKDDLRNYKYNVRDLTFDDLPYINQKISVEFDEVCLIDRISLPLYAASVISVKLKYANSSTTGALRSNF